MATTSPQDETIVVKMTIRPILKVKNEGTDRGLEIETTPETPKINDRQTTVTVATMKGTKAIVIVTDFTTLAVGGSIGSTTEMTVFLAIIHIDG
jgi:hypothetical protein